MANDLAVLRGEITQYEAELEAIMRDNKSIQALYEQIGKAKTAKEFVQQRLLDAMKSEEIKSWKTEQANFARSTRYSIEIDPLYKKEIEGILREGGKVEHFALRQTEFISITSKK